MTHNFILIADKPSRWRKRLKEAISPVGELRTLTEKKARTLSQTSRNDVVIIDESRVKRAEELINAFSTQFNPPPIVVLCARPPDWEHALRLFKAGATDYVRRYIEKDKLAMFFKELLSGLGRT